MKIILMTALMCLFFVSYAEAENVSAPEITPPKEYTKQDIMMLIGSYSIKYGVSSKEIYNTIKCESSFNIKAVNMKDSHKLSKGSHGIAQFSRETIKGFGKEIGIENADPYNPEQAIEVMAYMFSKGEKGKRHWTCYRLIKDV